MKTLINAVSSRFVFLLNGFLLLGMFVAPASSAHGADAELEEVLSQARNYLGSEDSLNSVEALRFVGTLATDEGPVGEIEIILKRPCHQYQILRGNNGLVVEAGLNDYEAWRKRYSQENPKQFSLMMAQLLELKRLRANCLENLNFFSSKRIPGRRQTYKGIVEVDGQEAYQVEIRYGQVCFIRNFDVDTGKLIMTRLENGEEIREEGNTEVDGIRFPLKLITHSSEGASNTITFETIEVNPEIDDTIFEVPSLTGN